MILCFGIAALLILLILSLLIVCYSTLEIKSPALTINIKVDPKKNIIAIICLSIAIGILIFYAFIINSPLEKVAYASLSYYSCLETKTKPEYCERKNNKLLAEKAGAEMAGTEKSLI